LSSSPSPIISTVLTNIPTTITATKSTRIDSVNDAHSTVAKSSSIHHHHGHHKIISLLPIKSNWHRSSIKVKRAEPEHVSRSSCSDDADCSTTKTKCLRKIGLCGCPRGYVIVDLTARHRFQEARETLESNQSKYCYKLKKVSESCEYDVQCFVSHSLCDKSSHSSSSSYSDRTGGTCVCSSGHSQQGELIIIQHTNSLILYP